MENIPTTPQNQQAPAPLKTSGEKNKITTPLIIIIVIIVIGGCYFAFQKWQRQRAANNYLKQLGISDTSLFGSGIGKIAEQIAKEEAIKAKKTPIEIFAAAETINIADSNHRSSAENISNIIKETFGDSKITGFTSGYMGMNSDSVIIQYTVPVILSMDDINALKEKLEQNNFEIIVASQQDNSASIMAQKINTSYTFNFNANEQEIMLVAISF